jgi:hypothetical protein
MAPHVPSYPTSIGALNISSNFTPPLLPQALIMGGFWHMQRKVTLNAPRHEKSTAASLESLMEVFYFHYAFFGARIGYSQ